MHKKHKKYIQGLPWWIGGVVVVLMLCFYIAALRSMVPADSRFPHVQLVILPVDGCEAKDPEATGTAIMANVHIQDRCGSIASFEQYGNSMSLIWQQTYTPDGKL